MAKLCVGIFFCIAASCISVAQSRWELFEQDLPRLTQDTVKQIQANDVRALGFSVEIDSVFEPQHVVVTAELHARDGMRIRFPIDLIYPSQLFTDGEEEMRKLVQFKIVIAWEKTSNLPREIFEPYTQEQANFVWSEADKSVDEAFSKAMKAASSSFVGLIKKLSPAFGGWRSERYEYRGEKFILVSIDVANDERGIATYPVAYYHIEAVANGDYPQAAREAFIAILERLQPLDLSNEPDIIG